MQLEELFATSPKFMITSKQKEYTLRVPNLQDRVKFKEILGGHESKVNEIFSEYRWDVIAKLVYVLLVEKEDFQAYTEKGFDDDGNPVTYLITAPALLMRSMTSLEEATQMLVALTNALSLSDPIINEAVKGIIADQKKKPIEEPDWAAIFDAVASEYGYTPKQFGQLTMRQLDAMLRQIDRRRHNEMAITASFHGIRIPIKGEPTKLPETSEQETIAMDKAISEAKLRKSQERMRQYG